MKFEWDGRKAKSNRKKHDVSFEEAETVFTNPLALIFDDEWHSENEEREIIIGHASDNRLLLVCFTERGDTVRLISAREATNQERRDYERNVYLEKRRNDK